MGKPESRKEVKKMSEEQKKQAEAIVEAANKLDENGREVAIAYIQGMAAAASVMQKKA